MLGFEPADQAPARSARMEQRLSPETKELIERAARLQGVNASEFVISHATIAARETLQRLSVTTVDAESLDAFMRAFADEAPGEALVELMRRHRDVAGTR